MLADIWSMTDDSLGGVSRTWPEQRDVNESSILTTKNAPQLFVLLATFFLSWPHRHSCLTYFSYDSRKVLEIITSQDQDSETVIFPQLSAVP
jgi:hypothetical protein